MSALHRRDFIKTATVGGAGAWALGALGSGGGSARAAGITATRLSDRTAVFSGAGGNVLVTADADGLLMVDSAAPGRTDALLKRMAEIFGEAPVHTLFNTHWHLDHTGGNEALARAGADILAHESTRRWMGMEFHVEWQDRSYRPRPQAARPSRTFYTGGEMVFGGRPVQYGHLARAHTDGDIYVFLPEENILAAGGVVAVGEYPIPDYESGGWIGELTVATEKLLEMTDSETRVIPGKGPVRGRQHLQAQYDMLNTVLERLPSMMRQGMSAAEIVESGITKEFDEDWGDPSLFIETAYLGAVGHFRDLGVF